MPSGSSARASAGDPVAPRSGPHRFPCRAGVAPRHTPFATYFPWVALKARRKPGFLVSAHRSRRRTLKTGSGDFDGDGFALKGSMAFGEKYNFLGADLDNWQIGVRASF
jgi:hypothetical protein